MSSEWATIQQIGVQNQIWAHLMIMLVAETNLEAYNIKSIKQTLRKTVETPNWLYRFYFFLLCKGNIYCFKLTVYDMIWYFF